MQYLKGLFTTIVNTAIVQTALEWIKANPGRSVGIIATIIALYIIF